IRDGLGQQGLSRTGGAIEQDALWCLDPDPLEDLGVSQRELDHLADFLDLVLEAADVLVGHPRDAYVLRFVDGPEAEHRLLADYHWPAGRHGTLDCEIYRLTHDVEGKGIALGHHAPLESLGKVFLESGYL